MYFLLQTTSINILIIQFKIFNHVRITDDYRKKNYIYKLWVIYPQALMVVDISICIRHNSYTYVCRLPFFFLSKMYSIR